MEEPRRRIFEGAGGVRLVADVYGEPRRGTVLLAHGGGQTRHSWTSTASALAKRGWQATSLDLRGHGESDWSSVGDYRMQCFAEDILAVGRILSGRPALIGASLGGLAGLFAEAEIAPGTFSSITLVDIVPNMDPSGVAKIMGFMGAHLEEGFGTLEEAADAIAAYLPHRPKRTDRSGLGKNLRRDANGRYRWHWDPRFVTGIHSGRSAGDADLFAAAASKLSLPVHLIRGRLSELVSREAAEAFVTQLPNGAFTDVAGASHMVAGDRNDAFLDAVLEFFERPANEDGDLSPGGSLEM